MATRGRKPKQPESSALNLIEALGFVSVAQRKEGEARQTHCVIQNNWVLASDGAITAGHKIEDSIKAAPRTSKLLAALKKCQGFISIVQLNENKISIKSQKFTASIDCINFCDMPEFYPDPKIAIINDSIKLAFKACVPLVNESSPKEYMAGVLLQANTAVSTNGVVLIEFWHGLDLPPGLLIPKAACAAVASIDKPLTGFGFTQNSVTFHFADDSFIKSQLFNNNFPNYLKLLEVPVNPWPIPEDFYEAIDHLLEFCEHDKLYFENNLMKSSNVETTGASYVVNGLTGNIEINGQYLKLVQPNFKNADFTYENKTVYFFSDSARGIIKGFHK